MAGHLANGQRKKGHVVQRSMITLDADSPRKDLWEDFLMMYDCAALLYSTHSHRPEKPRYRIIIPLSRPVTSDEYVPIALKIADNLGLDNFDDTTYQPERLMYWSSHSRDAEYVFETNDADFLDPDEILNEYPDWTDISYWPELPKAKKLLARDVKKAGEPTEKPGLIGVFCRQFTISEAVAEFIPEVYTPTEQPDRWTYAEGSTSGGLVVYDDKFAYSHHSTDPAGEQLVNAWDMVRIHKFVELDDDAKEGPPVSRLPSNKAMTEFVNKIPTIKSEVDKIALGEAESDFDEYVDTEVIDEDDQSWLQYSQNGSPIIDYNTLAKRITKEIPIFYNDTEFAYYDRKRGMWRSNGENFIESYTGRVKLKKLTRRNHLGETMKNIKTESHVAGKMPEKPQNLIVLKNGIYDIHTGKYSPGFDPDLYARSCHPIEYDPDADCPIFDGYLDVVVGENKATIYEWIGFLFYGIYNFQKILFLYGSGGTGKSTLIRIMQDMIGDEATSAVSLEALIKEPHAMPVLFGKTANFDADAKPEFLKDGSLLKKLTGDDPIYANPKNEKQFWFRNFAKLTFSMNSMPAMTDHSGGLARRAMIIKMDVKVTAAMMKEFPLEVILQETPGIFNKAMQYFREALKRGTFTETDSMKAELQDWLEGNDTVAMFIKEATETVLDSYTEAADLFSAYKSYSMSSNYKPLGRNKFYDRVVELGHEKVKQRVNGIKNPRWVVKELKPIITDFE
ncbi:DNA primase family protein [Pseudolactococcus reticulitermitis]|uniref:DNA primase family protein n=1 Tax=Pseudolactococcus reticulitermitis TaxID=2025039 RepID=UPI0012FF71D4|nr:DNA primase family protein [Lactococcus reticulitermitis]